MILCAAGDPGGSRAVLPVVQELARRGAECRVVGHGFLGEELPPALCSLLCTLEEAEELLARSGTSYIFGSSVSDGLPLRMARKAKNVGGFTVHLLDNWSSYALRLKTDGADMLVPDVYAVMDEVAKQGALAEGIPASCLRVTGHPAFSGTAQSLRALRHTDKRTHARRLGLPEDRFVLVFVCEPFKDVFGSDLRSAGHPGFTEETVLNSLLKALVRHPCAGDIYFAVLPHPKQNSDEVEELWQNAVRGGGGDIRGGVLHLPSGRDCLPAASGICGMASILLYEAWLGGMPVLCLQPGCRLQSIKSFALLDNIVYVAREEEIPEAINAWPALRGAGMLPARPELSIHEASAEKIADIVLSRQGGHPT